MLLRLAPPLPKVALIGSDVAMAHGVALTGVVILTDLSLAFLGGLIAFSDPAYARKGKGRREQVVILNFAVCGQVLLTHLPAHASTVLSALLGSANAITLH